MSKKSANPAFGWFPSLTDVAFILPILFLFLRAGGARALLGDGDTGWHIRTGEWILQNGRIPRQDLFSFTMPDKPWFAWEWLWDASFAWLHQRWGLAGVVMASIAILGATSVLVYRLARRKCPNVLIAIGLAALVTTISTIHWLARPHLVTLLMVAVFYTLLERAREGKLRLLWALPALTVLWTNLHGGFILGILLASAYAGGEFATWLLASERGARRTAMFRGRLFTFSAAGCLLASLINPYFYHLHVHIFQYLTGPFIVKNVQEFQAFDFQSPLAAHVELMAGLAVMAAVWSLYHRRFTNVILLCGSLHVALASQRNLPIFGILAAPAIAEMLWDTLQRISSSEAAGWLRRSAASVQAFGAEVAEIDFLSRVPAASMAAMLLLVVLFRTQGASAKFRAEFDPQDFPARAVETLKGTDQAHAILTSDQWGDYLIYRLHPNIKVFFDGRSDFYGEKLCEEYERIMKANYDWKPALKRHGVDTVLLPVGNPLASTLKESSEWRPIYDDGMAIVFRSTQALALASLQPKGSQSPAATSSGFPAIVRSPINNIVIERSQYYARR